MRASRLLAMLILLQLRVRLTAEALAEEFEVSVRTIYRDIDALSAAGVPVYGDRGPGGGYRLIDGYRTRLTGLAVDEAQALPMIGLQGPAEALGLGAAAARARGKLFAAIAPSLGAEAGRLAERFHLDAADWYREEEPATHLPTLARAVLDQRRVAMTYESWTATREWAVEPLGLVLKGGGWYLVATGGGKVRTFRVGAIHTLSVEDGGFARPEDFDLAGYWRASLERFEAGLRPGIATVRVSPRGARWLGEAGAYAERAVAAAGAAGEDGWVEVRLPVEGDEQAARLFLSLGAEAVVSSPTTLRERISVLARGVAERHS